METMLEIIERENIFLDYDHLNIGRKLFGLYWFDPARKRPFILLDNSLRGNTPMHRSILAEELGHHFTIPQTNFLAPYTSYSRGLRLGRDEIKALRWACDFLMPMNKFDEALQSGITQIHEIAAHFNVTPWLVYKRIYLLRADEQKWQKLIMNIQIV